MKKRFAAFAAAAAVGITLLTGCQNGSSTIRFGTAGTGGSYQTFAAAFSGNLEKADDKLNVEVKTTAGSSANLRLLSQNYIQMAVSQADMSDYAYYGRENFKGSKKLQGYRAVGGLYTEACQVIVRKDKDIHSVADLEGKTVSIGESESGTEQNAKQILTAYGLSDKLVTEKHMNYSQAAQALEKKTIDAAFVTSGTPTTVFDELSKKCDIRLLPISGKAASRLQKSYHFYTAYTIPAHTYQGQNKAVKTLGIKAILLVSDSLDDDTVSTITKTLFSSRNDLQYAVPVQLELNEKTAVKGITIPFHKGAAEYYAKKGISVKTDD